VGAEFTPSLEPPFRWRDWAAPPDDTLFAAASGDHRPGWKRRQLNDSTLGGFFGFVNGELLPYLRGLRDRPNATPHQKVISEILTGAERVRIDSERNLLDVLDKVHAIRDETIDPTHVFPLSQVYEGLLLKMGEKGNDGGQFFTPHEVIRAMVRTVNPRPGETVYDPCCGTGGFLVQSYEHLRRALGDEYTPPI
jgi:type I restriction enzyme M protein